MAGIVTSGGTFASQTGEVSVHSSIPIPTGFDSDHTSVIAAVLKVTYQGDWDDASGKIEIGIAMHDDSSIGNIPCVG